MTGTRTRKTSTRTAAPTPRPAAERVGASGRRVAVVDGVAVEVNYTDIHDGGERITSVSFPLPGDSSGSWAVVQIGQLDGSRWAVGFGGYGWHHDEFPTLLEAVAAVRDPKTRRAIVTRTEYFRRLAELRRACPPPPPGAVVDQAAAELLGVWPASCVV